MFGVRKCSLFGDVPAQNLVVHGANLSKSFQHGVEEICRIDLHLPEVIDGSHE